ncbi:disease resistance protein RPV1-like isoform X3 [Populus nigra]|uniref:disease resistance protein RPV1-like isoform X3 n=1 Tax=Populus nigra TaxID=3691 RepID=UPI002B275FEB|nr:disease resistance protein RPV1-like isoform X3 [Populus nigra]XP_061944119.1 disease resistance protein RPV1-like isoform X3 [Populus nigra]XP_061944121.1 disease resistance protein RPV1-like isoform X3 [Populus nigra]
MTEPESSRSRPEGAYDVVLSFRGEDTRKTFVDHLYTALVQAGIHTFRDDDQLPRGEEISENLLEAIRESKISIVVFSKGYASSRWCLNELVEILKCKRKKTGQIVLPIFYDIDPSDVRKQTGSFAEAFDKHEERFEEKLVKEWRKALEEAGNLSGWNLNDMANGHEAKFIKEIIKDVLKKLEPKYLYVPEHLVGMDRLARNIFDFLSTATDDVRIVGIHGMPGIGKTTIAQVVFNQLCYEFEGSCFLSDINERSKQFNGGLVDLQKQLLRDILNQYVANFDCVDRGKVLIKERLRRKRVLVVADDVAHPDQRNALMGDRSWFGPGSRVIITTRDSDLLREADLTCQIEELEPDESLQLFSRHAFKDTKPAEDYIELSTKAVGYCGGLPLALKVIGACLYGKNKDRWESEIDNLSRIPNQDIQGKLLISYHALDGELQRAFLDIACFFIGIEKEYVAKVLGARCRLNPEVVLETLRERSLIQFHGCNIKDKKQLFGEMVAMHDLLRDMGREVVCKASPLLPGKRTRIWNKDDAWNVLDHQKGTEVVEGLALDVRASEAKSLSAGSFAEMKFLNLLQINGVYLTGSFELLSKELMWICWHECPLKYFPSDFTGDYLVVLDMQYSNLKELWKGKKILDKLKILNLSHSQHLIKTPNLHSSSLEKLILKGCSSLVEVHQSIGHSTSLVFLNLEGCRSLKTLPESIGNVKSLQTLNISGCSQLEKLPERMGDMESLTELLADGIKTEQFLSSIGQLKYVRRLSLRGCSPTPPSCSLISAGVSNLKRWLPTSFTEWRLLKRLKLFNGNLSDRATNCVDFRCLSALEELDLDGNEFSSLPSGIGFLPKLGILTVRFCSNLVSIPDLPSSLDCLVACDCKSLERVRIPIQSKKELLINLYNSHSLEEIQGIEGLNNSFWSLEVDRRSGHSPKKLQKSVFEAMCNGRHSYRICPLSGKMPNWMSYSGEGCSLSFHIPPVFHGLVVGFVCPDPNYYPMETRVIIIIRNKSNGIQLFDDKEIAETLPSTGVGWIRYISRSEMAMENYCGDDELELCISSVPSLYAVYNGLQVKPVHVEECGVHVIAGKSDSFEEAEVGRDTVMLSPPLCHLLPHPHCGSITASTPKQWSDFLFAKLQELSFDMWISGIKDLDG